MVLLSILADLAGVLRIKLDSPPAAPLPHAHPHAVRDKETTGKGSLVTTPASAEDVGEVVSRGKETPESRASGEIAGSDSGHTLEKSKDKMEGSTTRKKKSRKKRNTIDDLFNGVL